jgi:hypothetical protein
LTSFLASCHDELIDLQRMIKPILLGRHTQHTHSLASEALTALPGF